MGVTISENLTALVAACILTVTGAISIGESTPAHIDLNPNVSDSVAVGEDITAVTGTCIVPVSDSVSTSENTITQVGVPSVDTSDAISISESIGSRGSDLLPDVSDSISTSEDVEITPIVPLNQIVVSDSVSVGESGTIYWNFASVYITESVSAYIYTPTFGAFNTGDSVSITEFIKSHLSLEVNVSDGIIVGRTSICASDSITITEAVFTHDLPANTSDAIAITESVSALPPLGGINVSDTVAVGEETTGLGEPNVEVSDSVTTGEATSALVPEGNASASESISVADVVDDVDISLPVTLLAESEDGISIGETVTVTPLILPFSAIEDSISLAESIIAWIETTVGVSDSISIGESTEATLSDHAILVSDSISTSESVEVYFEHGASVSESISISELVDSVISAYKINVSESISVNDSVVSGTLILSVSQAISISESVSILLREKEQEIDLTLYLDTAKSYNFSLNTAENITLHIKRAYSREFIR